MNKWSINSYFIISYVTFASIFAPLPIFAQSQEDVDTSFIIRDHLEEITLTARKGIQPTPLSIQRLPVSQQYFSAVERLDQFLNFVPGVEMQSGALNTNRIHIRGIGSRSPFATSKIKAFLDDIPLTDGVGETSMEDLNIGFLQQIELWRGPFTSAYGAPLGGVMRFKSPSVASKKNQIRSEFTLGDFGFRRMEHSASQRLSNGSFLYLNDEILSSDGYRDNNNVNKHNFNGLWKKTTDQASITLLMSYINLEAQIPSSLNENDFSNNPSIAAANWQSVNGYEDYQKFRLGINHSHSFDNQSFISNTLYGYFYDSYELRPFNVLDDDSRALSIRTRYFKPFGKFNIEVGQETYIERYEYDIYDTVNAEAGPLENRASNNRRIINLYSEYFYEISNNLKIGGGFNYNHTSFTIEDLLQNVRSESEYDAILSPRFYIAYDQEDFRFRAEAAHGFANPSLDESIGPDGQFNPEIKQEEGWNYEVSTSYIGSGSFSFQATAFLMNVNDIIVNRQTMDGQAFGINGGSTRHRGIEMTTNFKILNRGSLAWNMRGNISIGSYRFVDFIDRDLDFSGNQLTGVAPSKWSLQSIIMIGNTRIALLHRYVDAIPVDDANSTFNDDFNLTNLLIQQDINIGSWSLGLVAEIENLLDIDYASMVAVNASAFGGNAPRYYYPGLPINGRMTLQLSYKW